AAEEAALRFFATLLDQGESAEQVEADVLASPEYFQARGGGTTGGFLDALSLDAVSHAPDAGGQPPSARLLSPQVRGQVALSVLRSADGFRRLVDAVYQDLLGRAAEPGGLVFWAAQLERGMSRDDLIAAVAG